MSQKSQSDGGQKHFAVGRGLLAAAETLNFNMNDQRSSRQMGGMSSGVGGGGRGMEGQDSSLQMPRHGGSSNLGSTMKLFASLGLSPSDLDALAEIPEEEISVETLPHILMQLKSRKGDTGERRVASSMSSDAGYRGSSDSWDDMGRMGSAVGQSSARAQTSADFGFSSLQEVSSSRGYSLNYSGIGSGGESRERQFSELPRHDSYGRLGMGAPSSDAVFMQRRMGSPSNGKVQDFLGVMPSMFPHVCALCDFDVHSTMEWNQHINGLRHAENRRLLLDMYPEWDPGMASVRGGGTQETPNLSAGLLGPAPMSSSRSAGGMSSNWGGGGDPGLSGKNKLGQNKLRSRVVVVKYTRKPLSNKTLFAFAEPFGCLREHLVLSNKAFLEMDSHEEAQDMVNYYNQHPPTLYGKPISIYLSTRLMAIQKEDRQMPNMAVDRSFMETKGQDSQVVFFSNLPREEEKKKELLTIAGRFGTVEKHLFLTDQAFVQLGTPQDAEMLVKYYTVNPLIIKGRPIRLNICAKYKTLNVNRRQGGDSRSPRGSRANTSSSSSGSRTSAGPKTTSPKAPSISRVKAEKKNKEENKAEEKPATEEGEEEACEVMEGEESKGEEQETNKDHKVEEPEVSLSVEESLEESSGNVQEEETLDDGVDISNDTPAMVGGAEGEAESQGPTETEASADGHEQTEEPIVEPGESSDVEGETPADLVDQDFLENMEDFVTLDEVADDEDEELRDSDTIDNTRRGGLRVVHILGFRRGYNFFNELLGLAKPFGEVVKHLVLDLRPEAFLQFATEEEARSMAKFYNSNVTASVCGRPVRVIHSMTYPTIQSGSSRVVYIGQIPGGKYSDEEILELAQPFGIVKKYFFNRIKRECFIEMEKAEDAEKMAGVCKATPLKLSGKYLTVYVSRKYRQLKHGHRRPSTVKRENSSTSTTSSKHPDEPPAKKLKEEKKPEDTVGEEEVEEERQSSDVNAVEKKSPEVSDQTLKISEELQEEKQEQLVGGKETSTNQNGQTEAPPPAENKPSVASLPLPPYDAQTPIGVEHVKMGYYCRVCFLFYSNEDMAKKTHCSSQAHYDKLQKYLEKEQSKVDKKETKDNVVKA